MQCESSLDRDRSLTIDAHAHSPGSDVGASPRADYDSRHIGVVSILPCRRHLQDALPRPSRGPDRCPVLGEASVPFGAGRPDGASGRRATRLLVRMTPARHRRTCSVSSSRLIAMRRWRASGASLRQQRRSNLVTMAERKYFGWTRRNWSPRLAVGGWARSGGPARPAASVSAQGDAAAHLGAGRSGPGRSQVSCRRRWLRSRRPRTG